MCNVCRKHSVLLPLIAPFLSCDPKLHLTAVFLANILLAFNSGRQLWSLSDTLSIVQLLLVLFVLGDTDAELYMEIKMCMLDKNVQSP